MLAIEISPCGRPEFRFRRPSHSWMSFAARRVMLLPWHSPGRRRRQSHSITRRINWSRAQRGCVGCRVPSSSDSSLTGAAPRLVEAEFRPVSTFRPIARRRGALAQVGTWEQLGNNSALIDIRYQAAAESRTLRALRCKVAARTRCGFDVSQRRSTTSATRWGSAIATLLKKSATVERGT